MWGGKDIKWDQCSLDNIRENISEINGTAVETIQPKTQKKKKTRNKKYWYICRASVSLEIDWDMCPGTSPCDRTETNSYLNEWYLSNVFYNEYVLVNEKSSLTSQDEEIRKPWGLCSPRFSEPPVKKQICRLSREEVTPHKVTQSRQQIRHSEPPSFWPEKSCFCNGPRVSVDASLQGKHLSRGEK